MDDTLKKLERLGQERDRLTTELEQVAEAIKTTSRQAREQGVAVIEIAGAVGISRQAVYELLR